MHAPPELDALMGFLGGAFRLPDEIPGNAGLEARAAVYVAGNERLTPAQQVDIYRKQFWLRHLGSLEEDYPGLHHLLGDDGFDAFCRAYLLAHPPRVPSLRDLGDDIVAFAASYEEFPDDRSAAAIEMVRYENAFIDLFDGADVPPLDPQKLASLPEAAWETAAIVLHPLLVLMRLEHPVHRVRAAVKAGESPALPRASSPLQIALFRREGVIYFEELSAPAFDLLTALGRGEALVPACEKLAAGLDAAAADALGAQVGPWFQQWTAWRWIIDVRA